MPGPKMGPRPADFCEELVRQSPTFQKWESLPKGEKLRYACRDFIKGQPQDEERLMRRIMIARRNNLRDHAILKRARKKQDGPTTPTPEAAEAPPATIAAKPGTTTASTTSNRKRRPASTFSDSQVAKEMDVAAVEATRSYRAWMALADGEEFIYNQKYVKGRPNQDWLLRKNIWRRMRYRRENKKLVTQLREDDPNISMPRKQPTASEIVDQALTPGTDQPGTLEGSGSSSETPDLGTGGANSGEHASAGSKRSIKEETDLENGERPAKSRRMELPELPTGLPTGSTFPIVRNPVPSDDVPVPLSVPQGVPDLALQHTQPSQLQTQGPQPVAMGDHSHHSALGPAPGTDDETAHAALTAAAAATASGAADDLVELSAVEAAVAAAANYVAAHQDEEDDDDDDDDDHVLDPGHHHSTSVHNPLEAAANAAALDSAAKLAAAAATAQEVASQQVSDEEAAALDADHVMISV